VTLAVGYGGRQEVLDAIRALLYEQADGGGTLAGLAESLTPDDIARHLYTAGQPDPDRRTPFCGRWRRGSSAWPGKRSRALRRQLPCQRGCRPSVKAAWNSA
jgi:hypothetical protein